MTNTPNDPEQVEVDQEVDGERLVFADSAAADAHALAVEEEEVDLAEDLVLSREPRA